MTAQELTDFAATLFRRPVHPMAGKVHFYETIEAFAAEFKAKWPDLPVPLGYLDPATGHIHISPKTGLMTVIHEVVHKVARETFPMGRQVLGAFLDEGITEMITRTKLGPRAGTHVYDPHVAFVEWLQKKVGKDVVTNAVLHGDYRSLRDAVKQAVGGSELKTFEFFNLVRSIGSDAKGGIGNRRALDEAVAMLEGTAGAKGVPPPPGILPQPKSGLPELLPGSIPGALDIKVTPKEYLEALSHVHPNQALDAGLATVEEIGNRTAQALMSPSNPRNAAFVNACQTGNWKHAGTLFHNEAAEQGLKLAGSMPAGYSMRLELTVMPGKGGSRLDILLDTPAGLIEIDWKTTGFSALSLRTENQMAKHAAHIAAPTGAVGKAVTTQMSKSWVDFVRPVLPGVAWP